MENSADLKAMEARLRHIFDDGVPFNRVLGLKVASIDPDAPKLRFDMRPELIGNPRRQILHGGVISAVLDVAAGFAVHLQVSKNRIENPDVAHFPSIGTIDLRVDYLRPGRGKYFIATGRVVRLGMAAAAVGFAQACLDEAVAWARERKTFGKALIEHQVLRHKLVEMQTQVHAARALVYDTAWKLEGSPRDPQFIAQLAMTKNFSARAMQFCADAAVQTLGGAGFMRGTRSERIYREAKVFSIGGGAEEIMKDLAAKQLGW